MNKYNMFNDSEYYEPEETFFKMRITNGTYQVQDGDNLAKIALEFDTTVDELIKLNSLTTTTVYPGQVLMIPEPMSKTMEYIVKPGDNLYQISKKYNTTIEELTTLNSLENNILYPNQILLIPYQENGTGMYYKEYITVEGDSIESIAVKFNTKLKKLMMYNDIMKLFLAPNQTILIPSKDRRYEIVEGDTWLIILNKSGLNLEELVELNKEKWFKPGNKIIIR